MSRTREWIKLGSLVGITIALAIVFAGVVDFPLSSEAQQPALTSIADRPPPVVAAQPVEDLGDAFVAVAEAVRPAVVRIEAESREQPRAQQRMRPDLPPPFDRFFEDWPEQIQPQPRRGQGSGFIISPDGYIVTNNHVVDDFDRFDVTLFDGRIFKAKVVGGDPRTDVAVIKIDGRNLPAVSLGDSDELRVGEWVLAIGNPLGREFSFTVTAGIVSGRGRGLSRLQTSNWDIHDFIQTDAAINPGNSGGPLVSIRGQVVGVNSAILSRSGLYAGYSFAIPINIARAVSVQLIKEGKVTRAALGVVIDAVDPDDAAYVGLDSIRGVLIQGFSGDDSPAKQAGLKPGDVIVEVDGEDVRYTAQLQQLIGFKRPGDEVAVTVLRKDGARRTLTVRLGEADTEAAPTLASVERDDTAQPASYQGKLGLALEPLEERLVSRLGSEHDGLVITNIDPDGPARGKGLREARPRSGILDIVTHVNDQRIQSRGDLEDALADASPGSIVSLRVVHVRPAAEGRVAATPGVVRLRVGGER